MAVQDSQETTTTTTKLVLMEVPQLRQPKFPSRLPAWFGNQMTGRPEKDGKRQAFAYAELWHQRQGSHFQGSLGVKRTANVVCAVLFIAFVLSIHAGLENSKQTSRQHRLVPLRPEP